MGGRGAGVTPIKLFHEVILFFMYSVLLYGALVTRKELNIRDEKIISTEKDGK